MRNFRATILAGRWPVVTGSIRWSLSPRSLSLLLKCGSTSLLLPPMARPWRAGLSCLHLNLHSRSISLLLVLLCGCRWRAHLILISDALTACTAHNSAFEKAYPLTLDRGNTIRPCQAMFLCTASSAT